MTEPEPNANARPSAARWLTALVASFSLVVGLVAGVFAVEWVMLRGSEVDKDWHPQVPDPSPGAAAQELPRGDCSERPCNYLILGSDSRAGLTPAQQQQFGTDEQIGGENRADTIMLVHTDPDTSKATIVSFPRDLWVEIPDRGFNKINSGFEGGIDGGGPQLMTRTVSNLTGLVIDHYLYVDLAGFQHVVDTIGGVDLCVPTFEINTPGWLTQSSADGETSVFYKEPGHIVDLNTGLDILPGCTRLDGFQSLAYVRSRHLRCDAPAPDLYRIRRQQQFLSALINQMLQPAQFVRAPTLISPIVSSFHRDEGLLPGDLVYLVGQLRGITSGAADFRSVPAVGGYEDGLSVLHMDPSAKELFAAIRENRSIQGVGEHPLFVPPSEANVTVAVVDDGAGQSASDVGGLLSDAGFDISPGTMSPNDAGAHPTEKQLNAAGAVIAYASGHDVEAGVVSSYFPGLPVVEVKGLKSAPVAVWVTGSYAAPSTETPSATPSGAPPAAVPDCPAAS
jgi:LCP family protein required for cell wall assembly